MGANKVAEVTMLRVKVSVYTGNNYHILQLYNIHTFI